MMSAPMFAPRFRRLDQIERVRIRPPAYEHLRLNRLERPEPWPEPLRDAIAAALAGTAAVVQRYPDYAPFHARLAAFLGVAPARLVIGAGIEEFWRTLILLCAEPGDRVATLWPTCAMVEVYARAFGAPLVRIETDPRSPPAMADVLGRIEPGIRLMLLANPGQPVETCYGRSEIARLAAACREVGCVLAVDEAYWGFGAPTALPLVAECDNVVVLRSFSKALGAAALRIGCAVAAPPIARALDALRLSGEVSGPSMAVATVLMDRWDDLVRPEIARICAGRDFLIEACTRRSLPAQGGLSNHVLVDLGMPERATAVHAVLAACGVHVRRNAANGGSPPLEAHLMVTCGDRPLMLEFFNLLRGAVLAVDSWARAEAAA